MLLAIDIGNSHIYGGLLQEDTLVLQFRMTAQTATSDEIGIFLKSVIRENQFDHAEITGVGICSVVPQLDYSVRAACIKYFGKTPFFLQAGVKTGLKIKYKNPIEVGADRIANAIAGVYTCPDENLIIIDFGTATTFCAIARDKVYCGGAILPGVRLSMESLAKNTAKLRSVDIIKPHVVTGLSTTESIQSGIFYGALGAAREIVANMQSELFADTSVRVIATGGFAHLFEHHHLYDVYYPHMVLDGIRIAYVMNNAPYVTEK